MQYVALMMMVAKATGYKPGKFTHFVQNLHIYDRHIEQLHEMLNRESSEKQPKLILDTDKTDFYSFTIDDFKVVDYEPAKPQLKFELGI
jgi:thymidylate synthase